MCSHLGDREPAKRDRDAVLLELAHAATVGVLLAAAVVGSPVVGFLVGSARLTVGATVCK